jgi:hypothetical protein
VNPVGILEVPAEPLPTNSPPGNSTLPEQQQDFVGTTLPIEYAFAAIMSAGIATVIAYLLLKRKKQAAATKASEA